MRGLSALPRGSGTRSQSSEICCNAQLHHELAEHQQAEEVLRQAEQLGRAILNSVPAQIAVVNREGILTVVNEEWATLAQENSDSLLAHAEVGTNYFESCRQASGWGVDFEGMEKQGKLRVVCAYPETASLEDHLLHVKAAFDDFHPTRVAVDSLSALERVSTPKGFREFVIGLTSFIKQREIAGLLTSTASTLMGGTSITEAHISTLTDSIILLRYVEMYGEVRRGLTVLKMRGSMHEKDIREFTIDGAGMHIGKPFRNVVGILAGSPASVAPGEIERLDQLFGERE